jgi:hypothetical protein
VVAAVTAEQHAATIREAILGVEPEPVASWEVDAMAALDALVALAQGTGTVPMTDSQAAYLASVELRAQAAEADLANMERAADRDRRDRQAAEERASQLEHERNRFDKLWVLESERAEKAEGELFTARREYSQLEHERDEYRAANESVRVCSAHTRDIINGDGCLVCLLEFANSLTEQARREADQLRAALDDIADGTVPLTYGVGLSGAMRRARAALAGVQAKEQ